MGKISMTVLVVFLLCGHLFACGGGLMAYTPSDGNSGGNSNKKADFFFINKGVSSTMFDVKALQPVFREVNASGNERNEKNLSKRAKKRLAEKQAADAEKIAKNQAVGTCDSTASVHHSHQKEDVAPVLNLHKLH